MVYSKFSTILQESALVVFVCMTDEEIDQIQNKSLDLKFKLYPVFMLISVVFLFFVLVAFYVTPEMQNLHGKSIACQSGSLMIAFIALTITNLLAGSDISEDGCKAFGETAVQ